VLITSLVKKDDGTDNLILRGVLVVVDTNNIHRSIGRRCGDDDFLGTTLQVGGGSKESPKKRARIHGNTYFSVVVKTP